VAPPPDDGPRVPQSPPVEAPAEAAPAAEPARPSSDELPTHVVPIDGVLDLHHFRPSEAGELVADYLEACAERGIDVVRIIHGKGSGQLREKVHSALRHHPRVLRFELTQTSRSGWGATLVRIKAD
jgi:DNA-nicking Smr family endonuclease